MNLTSTMSVWEHYHWLSSLCTVAGLVALSMLSRAAKSLSPTFRKVETMNVESFNGKMQQTYYAQNHAWNRKWGPLFILPLVVVVMPFCVTLKAARWWRIPLDVALILFVYDFVYYIAHRFLFHDSVLGSGPLKWMHAVHHRQRNPCRADSGYIHPLEVAIGLGLFIGCIFALSRLLGEFYVPMVVVCWFVFSEINVHNHTLWEADHFPFRYLSYASRMHHRHHASFTGGNFATITLLFDWMFGTLD